MIYTSPPDCKKNTMKLTQYRGRPNDLRDAKEMCCYDLLEELQIPFSRVDHAPAMTIEKCREAEDALGVKICKNLFLCNRQKTQFYLLLLRGEKVFHTKHLSAQLGCSRLSFASGEDMERILGVSPGSATVLALMNDMEKLVKLVIDRPVLEDEAFACHPCRNTSTVAFATKDLVEKILPGMDRIPTIVELPEDENA